jgi:uncharacterized protein (DUF2141 family)
MKSLLLFIAAALTTSLCAAQNDITVFIQNFASNTGMVRVGLYDEAGDFLERPYQSRSSQISERTATVTFQDVPDGTYAISCFHDEDNNEKLNMIMGMMPTEDYGCSNGAKGFFGPPKWEDASFTLGGGQSKKIKISL